jgi:hypothetical protein
MTTVAKLLARKQRLIERLQEGPGPHGREEIEHLLVEIDAMLDLLHEAGPAETGHEQRGNCRRLIRIFCRRRLSIRHAQNSIRAVPADAGNQSSCWG